MYKQNNENRKILKKRLNKLRKNKILKKNYLF